MTTIYVFNASIPLTNQFSSDSSIEKSEDKGDDMSTLVGTVLSGFENQGTKEKYDNLYKFFKDNEEKYQYTGFTKRKLTRHKIVAMKINIFILRLYRII